MTPPPEFAIAAKSLISSNQSPVVPGSNRSLSWTRFELRLASTARLRYLDVSVSLLRGRVALPEPEAVPLRIGAPREPAHLRHRLAGFGLPAEVAHALRAL